MVYPTPLPFYMRPDGHLLVCADMPLLKVQ
jgi:hypothetical protein